MKTKPISIRLDEDDLVLAQNLSGIKKPQKLIDLLLSEYVKDLKGRPIELPKDFMEIKKGISAIKKEGTVIKDITKAPPKSNYTIDTTQKESKESMQLRVDEYKKERELLGVGALAKKRREFLDKKISELEISIKYN